MAHTGTVILAPAARVTETADGEMVTPPPDICTSTSILAAPSLLTCSEVQPTPEAPGRTSNFTEASEKVMENATGVVCASACGLKIKSELPSTRAASNRARVGVDIICLRRDCAIEIYSICPPAHEDCAIKRLSFFSLVFSRHAPAMKLGVCQLAL